MDSGSGERECGAPAGRTRQSYGHNLPSFCFLRTAVRRLDTGCLLLAHWPRGVRTKAGLFSLVGTSGLHVKDIKAVR